jgi:hypothetical protein
MLGWRWQENSRAASRQHGCFVYCSLYLKQAIFGAPPEQLKLPWIGSPMLTHVLKPAKPVALVGVNMD